MSSLVGDQRIVIEQAILKTVLYSDLFDYPLTPDEITHYLIEVPADADLVRDRLCDPIWLDGQIARVDHFIMARGRESIVARRLDRSRTSDRLWPRARRFVRVLAALPFVRMVGITGALAMDNSAADDDIDVMIVTATHRVWLTRALSVALVYIGRIFGDTLCPNYMISESALLLETQTLFTAHEFMQMVPLYGFEVYVRMRQLNDWIDAVLPNAARPFRSEPEVRSGLIGRSVKRFGECLLSGRLGDRLEAWEMNRKMKKFQSQMHEIESNAILDQDHVKGHFKDYGAPVTRLYESKLKEFQLVE
ncbi:MAG TPA: hypothetical protein VFF70_12305 [Anaerolineae bacterium]|nr:hypothetical protein [Anaerolineae bacterium]